MIVEKNGTFIIETQYIFTAFVMLNRSFKGFFLNWVLFLDSYAAVVTVNEQRLVLLRHLGRRNLIFYVT